MGWTVRLALSAAIVTTVLATCPSFRWKQFRDMRYWRSFYSKITWYDAGQLALSSGNAELRPPGSACQLAESRDRVHTR
ncbi:hypothetical protein FJT64_000317 [Amphibalanus amphitrite]|uniref:Secreted protein n=1 Tax=Amphibalanus amphitrite TaxID=1232801 RepID=A0A6A4WMY1_AMPAM|nr:hypothetical protein FJT64_000317 [Amphibalanus amphitrite]